MKMRNDYTVALVIGVLTLFGFVYLFADSSGSGSYLFPIQKHQLCNAKTTQNTTIGTPDELEEALARASMAGNKKTVIIAVVNKAYVEGDKPLLDIFLDGFWLGEGTRPLVNHLLLVAMDDTSFDRCKFLQLHCYRLGGGGDDDSAEEHLFMSKDFVKMMWKRTRFLTEVLRRGYSFVFTDVDVMWLRDPFLRLGQDETLDLQFSGNKFIGGATLEPNHINTGFYMVRSSNKTVALFDTWYEQRNSSGGMKEQDVLENMIREGYLSRLGLKVWYHDLDHFSGFCKDSRDIGAVLTVHADCCRTVRAKVSDLIELLHDWKRFQGNKTAPFAWSEHTACRNSWH